MAALLITATIDSGYFGNPMTNTLVADTDVRREQYYEVLKKYILNSDFNIIVFAENSGYPFDAEYFMQLAEKAGKKFEYLFIQTDRVKGTEDGKAYGEAHLLASAYKKSNYLRFESTFYKVTGRVWIANVNSIIDKRECNQFITNHIYNWMQTVFFKVRVDSFERCLLDAENVCSDKSIDTYIEKTGVIVSKLLR